jgi:MmeI, DNA-methyltransferase domain/MmeI, N-terminal domain/MmeI, helicase spacer domain/MmeI, target recognition domain
VPLTPPEFVAKWSGSTRTERAASQEHFIDLCRMIGVPTPNEADPTGADYAFEKGAEKTAGGGGFADVWRRGYFAWEYKGKRKDLAAAYQQLLQYREALDNPPLLVVCDLDRFEVHTNFTNTPATVHAFNLADLLEDAKEPLRVLRAVMENPEELRPGKTRDELTAEAAEEFASLADRLRDRDHEPQAVAHFLNKLLFCMFAEDAGLLPAGLLGRLADAGKNDPPAFGVGLADLFMKMSDKGGLFGAERIEWFNGGLFDGGEVLPLTSEEIKLVDRVSRLDWSQVEPAIFGTLFERGLDPSKRSQLGAHYTNRDAILRLIEPVLLTPLRRDLEETQEQVLELLAEGKRITARTRASKNPQAVFNAFLDRLRAVRVLDPACGSGNFLYIALQSLKDLEREAIQWYSLTTKTSMQLPAVGPQAVLGIELNSYAAELARVVIWIGEIQWMLSNGFAYARDPILSPLDNIACRDAVLDESDPANPKEPEWPEATVIVGNPPFLGGGDRMRASLGHEYVDALFRVYDGRVPRTADFVTYWHEKARAMVEEGQVQRVGLLATQGIRHGASRRVLERIKETGDIFLAWSDEQWVVEGAAVHVSFIGFDDGSEIIRVLNGHPVAEINANLTAGLDFTQVAKLAENLGVAFEGAKKGGHFQLMPEIALAMLEAPNPDARSNRDVVRPWVNGQDITGRRRNMWIVDFGEMPEEEAALYEAPFEYIKEHVYPIRSTNRRERRAKYWWQHAETVPGLRAATKRLSRYLATPNVSKYRLFVWLDQMTLPSNTLVAFAREDDYFFGVLQSSAHDLWARRHGGQVREVESGFRYTPTTTFETFPFPDARDDDRDEIAAAAAALDKLRTGWLNPDGVTDEELRVRTLTNLYNERPSWLEHAHERLDRAVRAGYGWEHPLDPDDVLARLVELNLSRSKEWAETRVAS